MRHFVVERFVPGATADDLRAWAWAIKHAIDRLGLHDHITHLGSEFVHRDETCLCFFDATDDGIVRKVNEEAGAPYERVLSAEAVRL